MKSYFVGSFILFLSVFSCIAVASEPNEVDPQSDSALCTIAKPLLPAISGLLEKEDYASLRQSCRLIYKNLPPIQDKANQSIVVTVPYSFTGTDAEIEVLKAVLPYAHELNLVQLRLVCFTVFGSYVNICPLPSDPDQRREVREKGRLESLSQAKVIVGENIKKIYVRRVNDRLPNSLENVKGLSVDRKTPWFDGHAEIFARSGYLGHRDSMTLFRMTTVWRGINERTGMFLEVVQAYDLLFNCTNIPKVLEFYRECQGRIKRQATEVFADKQFQENVMPFLPEGYYGKDALTRRISIS